MNIRFLNKKEIKNLLEELNVNLLKEYVFLESNKEYYIVSPGIKDVDLSDLNIKSLGLLFAKQIGNKLILNEDIKDLNL